MDNNCKNGVNNLNKASQQNNSILQEDLLNIILKRWRVILLLFLLSGIAAFIFLTTATPLYISTAKVRYEKIRLPSGDPYFFSQTQIIKCDAVIRKIFENPRIKQLKTFSGVEHPVDYAKANLRAIAGYKDAIISVSFTSPYPSEAALIINSVIDSYINYYITQKPEEVTRASFALRKEKDKLDNDLSQKVKEMLELEDEHPLSLYYKNPNNHPAFRKLSVLSVMLVNAQQATIDAEIDLKVIPGIIDNLKIIGKHEISQLDLPKEIKTLLQSESEDTDDKELVQSCLDALQLKLEIAKQNETKLMVSFKAQEKTANNLSKKITEYAAVRKEIMRAEKRRGEIVGRINTLGEPQDAGKYDLTIVESAQPASLPSKPDKARVITMFLTMGLILGGTLAVFFERIQQQRYGNKVR